MPVVRYSTSAQITLDANGNGTLTIPGPRPGQMIQLSRVTVTCPNTKKIPAFAYFVGAAIDPNNVSTSVTGHKDTDPTPNVVMYPGEFITAVWSNADPNVIATITLYGQLSF